ncbi:hypothetical protein AB6A40_004549 [Gnathostoma spinigerum]|uniref:Phosphorylase b kinase regulatory subunit n=1 Tax=Gnathostoma spinigerum TaxID=75299 RepID=A0ABD6ECU5_9BILA
MSRGLLRPGYIFLGFAEVHFYSFQAALEAINGFNVYGSSGTSSSVIYVDIDGHNRNRTTFETILPRESSSKNTDAAILLSIGWPAFATHDPDVYGKSYDKCLRRLEGRYGLKRFFRDGYHTELEDNSKPYYKLHETCNFQDIECQFPIFFAYITITAQLRGDEELSNSYWEKLKDLSIASDEPGLSVLPECYVLEEDRMQEERNKPNSQDFYPASPLEFGNHLWTNAVYLIAHMLKEKLIHASDLDPMYRHLPASQRPKNPNRHSAFQGSMEGNPVVQIALIAESTSVQMLLSTYGISSQTPKELEPVQIWPSWKMVKVFESLGKDSKLNLGGRPPRPFGPLNTSKIFKLVGDTILCYPLLFDLKDFYINADPAVLIDEIKSDLVFISKRWKLAGRPTFSMLVREENLSGEYFNHMLDLLVALKNGFVSGVRVRIGRVHQLLNSGCMEHIDFATSEDIPPDDAFEELGGKAAQIISRTSIDHVDDDFRLSEKDYVSKSDSELCEIVKKHDVENLRVVAFAIAVLMRRYGKQYCVSEETLEDRMQLVYRQACAWRLWWLVRYCAAKLRKTMNSLAPSITNMLVRGKQVTLGVRGYNEHTVASPLTPVEITDILFTCCRDDEPQAAVLQQELIIACSDLICQKPFAFDGVLTIRLSWLSDAISLMLDYALNASKGTHSNRRTTPTTPSTIGVPPNFKVGSNVYDLSPTDVKKIVASLLTRKDWHLLTHLQSRRLNGSLNRVPAHLYDSVWKILERTQGGIVIASKVLPQQPTLSDMTQHELTFAYQVESIMSEITHPEYRQILVELLCIVAVILERNKELSITGKLDCDALIKDAFNRFCDKNNIHDRNDMTPFYLLDDSEFTADSSANYLAKAVIDLLLSNENLVKRKVSYLNSPNDSFGFVSTPSVEKGTDAMSSCIVS